MAIRDDFFTALANGAKWDVGVSINRTNPLPLDQYSVFKTETELNEYVAGAFAYPGQVIALVDETATTIYYLDQNKELQPVGIIPEGDDKTIEVSAGGAISLLGAAGAANGTLPMIGDDGKLTWKTLEDIGAGDGNDNTTYQFTLGEDGKSFSIKTLFNGQPVKDEDGVELDPQVITFNVYTKDEVDAKIGAASVPESTEGAGDGKDATGVYVAIEAEAARAKAAEKALDDAIKAIDFMDADEVADAIEEGIKDLATKKYVDDELVKKVDVETYNTDKKALEDEDAAIRKIAEDVTARVEAFLDGEDIAGVVDNLKEIQEELKELGDAVQLEEQFAAKADKTYVDEELAKKQDVIAANTYDAYGSAATAEQNAKDYADGLAGNYDAAGSAAAAETAAKAYADGLASNYDAAGAAATAEKNAKDHADAELAKKVDKVEGYGLLSAADQAKLNKLTLDDGELSISGSVEAGSVKNLDTWIGTNRDTVAGLYPTTDANKLAGIEAGAQANVIEGVQVNGTDLAVTGKKVNIDLSAYAKQADLVTTEANAQKGIADAATAKGIADGAAAKAAANEGAITGLDIRLTAAEKVGNDNASAISAHATEFSELKGRVDTHDTAISNRALKSEVYTKDEVNAITGTPTEGKTLVGMIGDKANSADVYTKDQVYTKTEIAGITGTLAENKTLVDMINDAKIAATYDDTAIKALIQGNTNDITNITKEGGLIDQAKAAAIEAATYDDTQVKKDIKANTDAIAVLNGDVNTTGSVDYKVAQEVAKILNDSDPSDIDTLNEIAAWIINDTTGAAKMNADIAANTSAITTINETTIPAAIATAKKYTDDTIAALDLANTYEAKGAAASALTEAKGYTDNAITALGMANYTVKSVVSGHDAIVVNNVDGVVTVGFADEIVLNGGSAN